MAPGKVNFDYTGQVAHVKVSADDKGQVAHGKVSVVLST